MFLARDGFFDDLGAVRLLEQPAVLAEARKECVKAAGGTRIPPVGPGARPVY